MSGVWDEMSHFRADVLPDDSTHVMNQIHQVLLQNNKKKKKKRKDPDIRIDIISRLHINTTDYGHI